jgi:hypothetical protein
MPGLELSSGRPFEADMQDAQVVLGAVSTTLIEAMLAGRIAACLNLANVGNPRIAATLAAHGAWSIHSEPQLEATLSRLCGPRSALVGEADRQRVSARYFVSERSPDAAVLVSERMCADLAVRARAGH